MIRLPLIRPMFIAAVMAAAITAPAFAETATTTGKTDQIDPAKSAAFATALSSEAAAQQARLQLARQGYVNISELDRDSSGHFTGTAMKDGKTVYVSVIAPKVAAEPTTN